MAVIREKFQFRNTKIGVTRIDTGAPELWGTIGNAADQLATQAFQRAEVVAKQTGKDLAESVSDLRLRTIDPETGKPEAFQVPSNFGVAAQAAYEETLDRRYIRSVDQEIRDKANETYLKYQFDPQGPEKYSLTMEDYVSGMTKNANARFQNIVRDTGAAYIASTKMNLLQKRNQRIQEQEQSMLTSDAYFAAETIQAIANNADLLDENSVSMMHIQEVYQEEMNALNAAVDAGILTNEGRESRATIVRRALPIAILQNTINFDATYETEDGKSVRMTEEVAGTIENSLSSGRVVDAVPDALKPYVANILESDSFDRDQAFLVRKASELRVDLGNKEGTARKATQLEIAVGHVSDANRRVDASKSINREAADIVIAQNTASLQKQSDPDMISYMMSPESIDNPALFQIITSKGIVPNSLETAFDKVFNLEQMSNEELAVVLSHYEKFANAQISSKNINVLTRNGGLSSEEDAFFRSFSALSRVKGSSNLVELAASLRSDYQNPELVNETLLRNFQSFNEDAKKGETVLTAYLGSKFGDDYTMHQMARPLVKYMSSAGMTFKEIDKQVTDLFETTYIETDGLVLDRHNKTLDRSMFAIARTLPNPNEQQMFILEVQKTLNTRFGSGKYTFTKNPIGADPTKVVKLVPINTNAATPNIVQIETRVEGIEEPQIENIPSFDYMAVVEDENGELVFLADEEGPVVVSTGMAAQAIALERSFTKGKEVSESTRKAKRKAEAQEELRFYEDAY